MELFNIIDKREIPPRERERGTTEDGVCLERAIYHLQLSEIFKIRAEESLRLVGWAFLLFSSSLPIHPLSTRRLSTFFIAMWTSIKFRLFNMLSRTIDSGRLRRTSCIRRSRSRSPCPMLDIQEKCARIKFVLMDEQDEIFFSNWFQIAFQHFIGRNIFIVFRLLLAQLCILISLLLFLQFVLRRLVFGAGILRERAARGAT